MKFNLQNSTNEQIAENQESTDNSNDVFINSLNEERTNLKKDLENLRKQLSATTAGYEYKILNLQNLISNLTKDNSDMEKSLIESAGKINVLNQKAIKQLREIKILEKQLTQPKDNNETVIAKRLDKLSNQRREIFRLVQLRKNEQLQLSKLNRSLLDAKALNEKLKQELNKLKSNNMGK